MRKKINPFEWIDTRLILGCLFYLCSLLVVIPALPKNQDEKVGNLIENPGFENNFDFWECNMPISSHENADISSDEVYSGKKSLKIYVTEEDALAWYGCGTKIDVKSNTEYRLSMRAKGKNIHEGPGVYLQYHQMNKSGNSVASGGSSEKLTGTFDWTKFTVSIVTRSDTAAIYIPAKIMSRGIVWMDDFSLIEIREKSPFPKIDDKYKSTGLTTSTLEGKIDWLKEWKPLDADVNIKEGEIHLIFTIGEEKDYWPNVKKSFEPPLNWSKYEKLEFKIYVKSPRHSLPNRSISLLIHGPDDKTYFKKDWLPSKPEINTWTSESINLIEVDPKVLKNVSGLEFFIWHRDFLENPEENYKPGDEMEFLIKDINLTGEVVHESYPLFPGKNTRHVIGKNEGCTVWAENATQKVFRDESIPNDFKIDPTISVTSARNEYEPFQIVISPDEKTSIKGPRLEFTDLIHAKTGARISKENVKYNPIGYAHIEENIYPEYGGGPPGYYPDVLLQEKDFDVKPGINNPVWITIYVPGNALSGIYKGKVKFISENSEPIEFSMEVKVWDFKLPEETHLKNMAQLWQWALSTYYPDFSVSAGDYPLSTYKVVEKLWQNFATHRVSPMHVTLSAYGPPPPVSHSIQPDGSVSINFTGFDEYLSLAQELKFNHWLTFYWGPPVDTTQDREYIRQVVSHYVEKRLLDKTFIYMAQFDEPGPEQFQTLKEYAKKLKETEPRIRRMVTVRNFPEELIGYIDIWCPALMYYDHESARARQLKGEEVWWYANTNFFINRPALDHRIVFWMTWKYHLDGLLFWDTIHWNPNPWESFKGGTPEGYPGNGDGIFLYPGREHGGKDFYETIRWELIREGIEDYEYMWLLKEKIKNMKLESTKNNDLIKEAEKILSLCDKIIISIVNYTNSPEDIYECRDRIGSMIEKINSIT